MTNRYANMTVYEYMEDYDNDELGGYDYEEQLREAVLDFNTTFNTLYDPHKTVKQYLNRKKDKQYGET